MVKRILGMLSKEVGNIHHAAYLIGFFAVLSQLLGLFRDRLFAYYFGAGQVLDVYYTSFKIPDFIFVSVASFVSISVLVPFVVERLKGDTDVLRNFSAGKLRSTGTPDPYCLTVPDSFGTFKSFCFNHSSMQAFYHLCNQPAVV